MRPSFSNMIPLLAPSGVVGASLLLDGVDQYVTMGSSATMVTNEFSVTIHFYVSSNQTATLISKSTAQSNLRDWELTITAAGKASFFLSSNGAGSTQSSIASTNDYDLDAWNVCTISLDTTAETRYITLNGTTNSDSWTAGHSGAQTDLLVGVRKNGSGTLVDYLDGSVSLPITTDTFPTAPQLTELETARLPEDYSAGLVALYNMAVPLHDSVIDPEDDRSADANDATLINSPTYTGEDLTVI